MKTVGSIPTSQVTLLFIPKYIDTAVLWNLCLPFGTTLLHHQTLQHQISPSNSPPRHQVLHYTEKTQSAPENSTKHTAQKEAILRQE